jgi:hypothetical protein
MMTFMVAEGFLANGKSPIGFPILAYFLASISFRGRITRQQVAALLMSMLIGVFVIYPVVHMMRHLRGASALFSLDLASEFIGDIIENPASAIQEWQYMQAHPDSSQFTQGVNYVGRIDDLETRFMLITTIDMIANKVELEGPYGTSLITDGFEALLPTFIHPNKPRIDTGDLLTWYYGLRDWDVLGYPSIGILADSFAALEWLGVILLPFLCALLQLLELQFSGTSIRGNLVGTYLLLKEFFFFSSGGNIEMAVIDIFRNNPIEIAFFYVILYFADRSRRNTSREDALRP